MSEYGEQPGRDAAGTPPHEPTEPASVSPETGLGFGTPAPDTGSRWSAGGTAQAQPREPAPPAAARRPEEAPTAQYAAQPTRAATPPAGVPPRPNPLPPPRPARPAGGPVGTVPRGAPSSPRPAGAARPVVRARTAKLVLRRIDPWSVFLYSVVASIFLGIALIVAVAVLYGLLSKLGVLDSVNTLIGDVTAEPGTTAAPSNFFSGSKILTFAALLAAVNVVLITALATLGAFLYNLCAALTGGIEVTLSDRDVR